MTTSRTESEVIVAEDRLMNMYQDDRRAYLQACAREGLNIQHAANSFDEVMNLLAAEPSAWAIRPVRWWLGYGWVIVAVVAVVLLRLAWVWLIAPRMITFGG